MTFVKSSRLSVLAGLLCLLLMGFAGASYATVRFDVINSPTEVIRTGRSEVLGSINLVVNGPTNITGSSQGGAAQIGIIYNNPALQIDNTTSTGIKMFFSTGFGVAFTSTTDSGTVGIVRVENIDVNGKYVGFITINMAPGATPVTGDYIRIEGVRGRIDASGIGQTAGTNFFAQMQSINDPSANSFTNDTVRIATSFNGLDVKVAAQALLLCFPSAGLAPNTELSNYIKISEGFARAFVDWRSSSDSGPTQYDRVDSGGPAGIWVTDGSIAVASSPDYLGDPTNSTQFTVVLDSIPDSIEDVSWQDEVPVDGYTLGDTIAKLVLVDTTGPTAGVAVATYEFKSTNQTGSSDLYVESFTLQPGLVLVDGATETGVVNASVTLAPSVGALTGLVDPGDSHNNDRPRFLQMYQSDNISLGNPPDDPSLPYADIIRCNCFLLFTYVTSDAGFDTGIAVANTTGDTEVFGDQEAADQLGKITFYFYDKTQGYVGSYVTTADTLPGTSYVNVLSAMLPGVTPTPLSAFSGYVIAKAEFQFCHALAFIADTNFAAIAHGYLANIIPDPSIKGAGSGRTASAAADLNNLPAGESLNN